MTWVHLPKSACSPGAEAESGAVSSLGTESSATSKSSRTAKKSSASASLTAALTTLLSGTTYDHSTESPGVARWISCLEDSPASHSQLPESKRESRTNGICGPIPSESLARYDPDSHCWRTYQGYLALHISPVTAEHGSSRTSCELLETCPKSGMTVDGRLYPLPTLEHHTGEKGSGYLPTPSCQNAKHGTPTTQEVEHPEMELTESGRRKTKDGKDSHSMGLADQVKYATPQARDYRTGEAHRWEGTERSRNLNDQIASLGGTSTRQTYPTPKERDWKGQSQRGIHGENDCLPNKILVVTGSGSLNPSWVGLLMGYPLSATCLNPMSMVEYKKWLVGFTDEKKKGTLETVHDMRESDDPEKIQGSSGGYDGMEEAEILQSFVCEHKEKYIEIGLALAGEEVSESELRSMWDRSEIAGSSHRRELEEHRSGESTDPLHLVSQIYPSYGGQAWMEGTWEATIPRVATGVAHRCDRLKAIGNGQVPAVVREAWNKLTEGLL